MAQCRRNIRGVTCRSDLVFSFHFAMEFPKANIIALDGTPRFAASHLGLFCLPMSHKKRTPGLNELNKPHHEKTDALHNNAKTMKQIFCAPQTIKFLLLFFISDISAI